MSAVGDGAPASAYPGAAHDVAWRRLVCPPDYRNPQPRGRYHLVVIGAGPAGLVASIAAAGLGAKVALVERHAMGGDCLNVGCVPSKSLLEHGRRLAAEDPEQRFAAAFDWLRAVRARIAAHDSVERYTAAGVDVFLGAATFVDERTVRVEDRTLTARRVIVATGARPVLPPVAGLAESRPLTNETVFDLRERPRRLAILGGGPLGCELAQGFARLGVAVELIEGAARLLPRETPEASRLVEAALRRNGVAVHLGVRIDHVARHGGIVTIEAGRLKIAADELLVAAGRRANTEDLNLAAVGVEVDAAGTIVVDHRLRTTNRRIYAAGDVCSVQQFTHNADAHARICVQNALFWPTASAAELVIPHCTYTDPEVAQVGATAAELEERGTPFDVRRVRFGDLDRGKTQGDEDAFAEVLTERGGDRILGATVVGPDAGEQIAPLCIAMTNGIGLARFAKTVLPYPTRAEYLRRLGDDYNRTRLTAGVRRVLGAWLKLRS
ncbi:MAG TPA: FAD-dependent oxidoreductase [Gammaproteobacteria bacterium]